MYTGWVEEAEVMFPPSIPPLKGKPCTYIYMYVYTLFMKDLTMYLCVLIFV